MCFVKVLIPYWAFKELIVLIHNFVINSACALYDMCKRNFLWYLLFLTFMFVLLEKFWTPANSFVYLLFESIEVKTSSRIGVKLNRGSGFDYNRKVNSGGIGKVHGPMQNNGLRRIFFEFLQETKHISLLQYVIRISGAGCQESAENTAFVPQQDPTSVFNL